MRKILFRHNFQCITHEFLGIVEKEELCNLIINHLNHNAYYEGSTTSSASTPNDFDNYTQSFDQIKQTCQSLFTSITDKIALDLQKTTCFNQSNNNEQRRDPKGQAPHFSNQSANDIQQQQPSTSDLFNDQQRQLPQVHKNTTRTSRDDCECSDNEDYDDEKISEKRESIANKRTKLSNSTSKDSDSPFEEVFVGNLKMIGCSSKKLKSLRSNFHRPPLRVQMLKESLFDVALIVI